MATLLVLFGIITTSNFDLAATINLDSSSGQFANLHTNLNEYTTVPDTIFEIYHFHGATRVITDQFDSADVSGLIVNIHLGAFSSPYRIYFSDSTRFAQVISAVEATLADSLALSKRPVRLRILTSFSAGYAAVREILGSPIYYGMIDAIILADGLHCNSDSLRMHEQMSGFVRFARDAAAGRKKMFITHSSIRTPGYQSTTQTAQYIIDQVHIESNPIHQNDIIGLKFRESKTGNLLITGYRGDDAQSHMKHFFGIHMLLNKLIH